MSSWTAILLAALVAARAPKGTFTGASDDTSAPPPAKPTPAAVEGKAPSAAEGKAPVAAAEPAGTSAVAAASANTGTVAGASASDGDGKTWTRYGKAKAPPTAEEKAREEEKARHDRLTAFWKKTPHYFIGTYGILSVIGMALGLYWLARYARRRERSVYYFRALLVTLAAVILADWTYFDIAQRLDVDRTAQEAAGRAWQEEVKAKEGMEAKEAKTVGERVEQMRFAEESDADRKMLKEAGQKGESQKDELDKALEAVQAPPPEDNEPEYRKKGRQKRAASTNKAEVVNASAAKEEVTQEKPWRVMLENDMFRATKYGRVLLLLSQLVCWLALAAFILDYLSRFNLTFDYFFPLPLALIGADRFIEMLILRTKPLTTQCKGIPRDRLVLFLGDVIRKGETFVYFGERDPMPDQDRLHRFSFGRLHLLPVRKFVCSSRKSWDGPDFVLESCWHSRGCFVVEGLAVAERMREEMQEFLLLRQRSRAWARKTVYFVWDYPEPPAPEVLDDMLTCGRNTNLKVVVFSPVNGAHATAEFQEKYEAFPAPRPSPALLERLIRGGVADTLSWMLAAAWTMLAKACKSTWPWVVRTPGYVRRIAGSLWALIRVVARGVGRGSGWAWPAVRGIGKVLWAVVRFVVRVPWFVCRGLAAVLGRGSKGAGGMFGKLSAWSKERKEKKAEAKAKREAEWKRLMEVRKAAEEKARQAAAAKAATAKESAEKAAAEKAALPGAGSLVKKPEAAAPALPSGKAALAERLKAKQAERAAAGGRKVDLAQIIKAKQAAAQAKAAGTLVKSDEAEPAAGAEAVAAASAAAKDAVTSPAQPAPQPPATVQKPLPAPDAKADLEAKVRAEVEEKLRKEREEKERQARETAESEARIKAEVESQLRKRREEEDRKARTEEDARKAREKAEAEVRALREQTEAAEKARLVLEESERQAGAKVEEDARKAREKAEAEERARREREEAERQVREKAEREERERKEIEARVRAEVEEKLRREREEAELKTKAAAEEEARKAREKAEAEERARMEREEAEKLAQQKTAAQKQPSVQTAPAAPAPVTPTPAGAAKHDAPAGAKRIVIVRKPGQGAAKPPVVAAQKKPLEQAPPAPPVQVSQKPPAESVAAPRPPEVPAPADRAPAVQPPAPKVVEEEREEEAAEGTGDSEGTPKTRSEPAPEPAPPRDAKRIVVMKKPFGGAAPRQPASEPRLPPPVAPPPRVPVLPPETPPQEPAADEIRFHCPHCGQHLAAPSQLMGRQLPCTYCKKPIVVPMSGDQAAPRATPPSSGTIMAAPMPPTAAPQIRVSFVPPRQMTQPPGRVRQPTLTTSQKPPTPQQPQQASQPDDQFKFFCPLCGQKLSAKREWVGRSLKCPACQKMLVIPAPN